ncbi:MAG: ArnT family glycosyltransferase [Phycisphaerales bacterium]
MTRHPLAQIGVLVVACVFCSFVGLTTHGLTNWQESQRLVVAREMQDHREWLVPSFRGQAYLAKPPMIYWAQIGLAELRGARVGLFDLRFVVAAAGLAGVLLTLFAARLLVGDGSDVPMIAALCLATGLLYVRSTRVGELDILLAPFTVVAVIGVVVAWRRAAEPLRRRAVPLALATVATAAAGLTKGPPAVALIGLACYGGMAIHAVMLDPPSCRGRRASAASAILATAAVLGFMLWRGMKWADAPGVLGLIALAAMLGAFAPLLARRATTRILWRDLSHTHPMLVLGGGFAAYAAWWYLASRQVDPAIIAAIAAEQVDNDLQLLVPQAPIRNLEALAYGCGIGSLGLVAGLLSWIRLRTSPSRETCIMIAWVVLGFALLSLAGKGVPRYLTPLWPGVAILGGAAIARLAVGPRRPALWIAFTVLAVGQGAWFGYGREAWSGPRSPRALTGELLARGIDPARVASFEFYTPALDFYFGRAVFPVQTAAVAGGVPPWTIERLRDEAANAPVIVLLRAPHENPEASPAARALSDAGLNLTFLPMESRFVIDNWRADVRAAVAIAADKSSTP